MANMGKTKKTTGGEWNALRLKFVNGTMTLEELALENGIKPGTMRQYAARNGWREERDVLTKNVAEVVARDTTATRIKELSDFNDRDLQVARALRSQVAAHLTKAQQDKATISPNDLNRLAQAAERAQKMGRLALGVSTENTELSGNPAKPVAVTNVPIDAYLAARAAVLDDF
jgi:GAF domain-containing protein